MNLPELLAFATRVAGEAGDLAAGLETRGTIRHVKGGKDYVTDGDLRVEQHILDAIAGVYPDHGYISEERGEDRADAEYVWILDPVDGTKYYYRGAPLYSVSLALRHRDQLVLGVVHCPETQQTFAATAGGGARLNDRGLESIVEREVADAIICIETPGRDAAHEERLWALDKLQFLTDNVERVRVLGVGSLGVCWSASGVYDAYINLRSRSRIWDTAAAEVVMQEVGGKVSRPGGRLIAAAPKMHDTLIDLLHL